MSVRPNILIGTPTFDRTVHTEYHLAILGLLSAGLDASFSVDFPYSSLLPMARNYLVTRLIENESLTHLLFVDSDMGFQRSLVARMLAFDQPVVGCIYPRRWLDHRRLSETARARPDLPQDQLVDAAMGYVGEPFGPVRNGFVQANYVGTGILLLQRPALLKMRETYPELWVAQSTDYLRSTLGQHVGFFQPFTPLQQPNGIYSGEDVAFCRRWIEGCGGQIWACADERITHSGGSRFTGNFAERLKVEAGAESSGGA